MKKIRYEWNAKALDWLPAHRSRRQTVVRLAVKVVFVVVLSAGLSVVRDFLHTSPEELALLEENRFLQAQVEDAHERIAAAGGRLNELEVRDQELYRIMLEADDIPAAVRQVGIGGSEPYGDYNRFSASTAQLVSRVEGQLDEIERRLSLQSSSTQELLQKAREYEARTRELPSIRPTKGRLTSTFGMRIHPIHKVRRHHAGVDFTVPVGTPVYATADGVVAEVKRVRSGYGMHIVISHPHAGYKTLYGHLSEVMPAIQKGVRVKRGQTIALSGNTGLSVAPHLHYEVHDMKDKKLDPYPFLAPHMDASEFQAILNAAARN